MTAPAGSIAGCSALVTGGGSGIGLATAALLASEGAHVTICGRTAARLESGAASIRRAAAGGASVDWLRADVTVEEDVAAVVHAATRTTGRLDILFACAGGSSHLGPVAEAEADAVRATVEVNLLGSFLCVKHAAIAMAPQGGGSIILMSSGAGAFPHRWLWAYGMAKAGIVALCASAAEELGASGIRVNAVAPGIIDDELMAPITAGGALLDDYIAQMPLGRLGTVDDVAKAVRWLAGPESAFVTGACLPVDGGHHLRRGADYSLLAGS